MLLPTRRLLVLGLLGPVGLALGGDGGPWALLLGAWLLLVAGLLVLDGRLTPAASAWELHRSHDERLSVAAWNDVAVTVRLRGGRRAHRVWLRDTPPAAFAVADDARIRSGVVTPPAARCFAWRVRPPRRGRYAFGDLYLRWESSLGLFRRQARFPAAGEVKVYPNLVDVRRYDLLLRHRRLSAFGLRPVRLAGAGTTFERLRDYQADDEYRRIHWKATARRGRPVSMEYETERNQNLIALLDVGRMMRAPVGDVAKMDLAINAVLMLVYVATAKGDRMGLLAFADRVVTWLPPRGGKGQFHTMLEQLYATTGEAVESDYRAAIAHLAGRHVQRSLVLLFTDLAGGLGNDVLAAHLPLLARRHLVLLVTIDDPSVRRMAGQPAIDSRSLYERTAAEALLEDRRLALDRLRARGVLTLDAPADRLSVAVIDRYLAIKARRLL